MWLRKLEKLKQTMKKPEKTENNSERVNSLKVRNSKQPNLKENERTSPSCTGPT
jgi:hypothetical protein